jgi:hypothetical protein
MFPCVRPVPVRKCGRRAHEMALEGCGIKSIFFLSFHPEAAMQPLNLPLAAILVLLATSLPAHAQPSLAAAASNLGLPGGNTLEAVASNLGLGPSVISGLAGIAAGTSISSLAVLAAYEQKMQTLKVLTQDVLAAKASITVSGTLSSLAMLHLKINEG